MRQNEREPPPFFFFVGNGGDDGGDGPHVRTFVALDRACLNQLKLPVVARDPNARSGRRINSM